MQGELQLGSESDQQKEGLLFVVEQNVRKLIAAIGNKVNEIKKTIEVEEYQADSVETEESGKFCTMPHAHHYEESGVAEAAILIMNTAAIEQLRNELDRIIEISQHRPGLAEGYVDTFAADGTSSTLKIKVVHLFEDFQRLPVPNSEQRSKIGMINPEHIVG